MVRTAEDKQGDMAPKWSDERFYWQIIGFVLQLSECIVFFYVGLFYKKLKTCFFTSFLLVYHSSVFEVRPHHVYNIDSVNNVLNFSLELILHKMCSVLRVY